MTRKSILSLAAATIGSGLIAVTAAHAFGGPGGHGHHHGSAAVKACIAVMTHEQRAGLKTIFMGQKDTLIADHQKVHTDQQTLNQVILGLNKSVTLTQAEDTLNTDKAALQLEKDALAAQICGTLSTNPKQLKAAQDLYTGLVALRESTHASARILFQDARKAAGDPPSAAQSQGNPAQNAE